MDNVAGSPVSMHPALVQQYPYQEGITNKLQMTMTKFKEIRKPKVAKIKWGYSSNASLVFQSWLVEIQMYITECIQSQHEAIQLVNDYTGDHMRSDVEFYPALTW